MGAVKVVAESENWVEVYKFDDLVDNVGICALINDKQVAIFRLSGSDKLYAIDNYDPFSKANVISRGVVGDLKGQIVVASPIYKQHFNLETGQCLEDESMKIPVYPIRVVDGMIQISE